jgi:azurin
MQRGSQTRDAHTLFTATGRPAQCAAQQRSDGAMQRDSGSVSINQKCAKLTLCAAASGIGFAAAGGMRDVAVLASRFAESFVRGDG